jgi:uncharacterized membrane protein YccC
MRKEFPPDKWIRKHTPQPILVFISFLLFVSFLITIPLWSSVMWLRVLMCGLLGVVFVICFVAFIWQIVWDVKYPREVEFCKECGRAKPEKFED